jgi:hypothetical protein
MDISWYQGIKLVLVSVLGLSKDALHVYTGMIVFLFCVILFRRPRHRWWPVVIVLLLAMLGELLDMRDDIGSFGYWRWDASLRDVINTSLLPVATRLMMRYRILKSDGKSD